MIIITQKKIYRNYISSCWLMFVLLLTMLATGCHSQKESTMLLMDICLNIESKEPTYADQSNIKRLISQKAIIYYNDWILKSPLRIALKNKNDSLVCLLVISERDLDDSVLKFVRTSRSLQHLIDVGHVNPNSKDWMGQTALHHLVVEADSTVVETLLYRVVDPNAYTNRGYTPMHYACNRSNVEMVRILLNYNAKLNAVSYCGYTTLHMAVGRPDPDMETIKLLLENGVNVNTVDCEGNTALHIANWYGKQNILDFLLQYGANPEVKNNKGKLYNQTILPEANRLRMFL